MTKRLLLGLAVLAAVTACEQTGRLDHGPGSYPQPHDLPVMLDTDAPTYPTGSQVWLRLVNRAGQPIRYNLCRATLERRNDEGDWVLGRGFSEDLCKDQFRVLAPGQSARFAVTTDAHSRRGQYRFRTTVESVTGQQSLDVVSNSFGLTRDSD
jgi:hypothetical protein